METLQVQKRRITCLLCAAVGRTRLQHVLEACTVCVIVWNLCRNMRAVLNRQTLNYPEKKFSIFDSLTWLFMHK
jgi:hypothetical protein